MECFVQIVRYDPICPSQVNLVSYNVPNPEGLTLLDALQYIQDNYDPTLGFRWECRKATCGVCSVNMDGRPVLACQQYIDPGASIVVAPLANFATHKDLIIDLRNVLERLLSVKPYLHLTAVEIRSKAEADASRSLRSCIECWSCVSMCPVVVQHQTGVADPLGMVYLARYALDVRDGLDRRKMAREFGIDHYDCARCQRCVDVCPKAINIPIEAIEVLRRQK